MFGLMLSTVVSAMPFPSVVDDEMTKILVISLSGALLSIGLSVLSLLAFPTRPEPELGLKAFPTWPKPELELEAPCPLADDGQMVAPTRSADEVETVKESPLLALLAVEAGWRGCAIMYIHISRVALKQLSVDCPSQAP